MLLLDTCTLIWLASNQNKLSKKAVDLISGHKEGLFISAVIALELGIKTNKEPPQLEFGMPLTEWIQLAMQSHGLVELPINSEIAVISTELPYLHRDPADRLLIATAIKHDLTIVTPDQHISAYPNVKTAW